MRSRASRLARECLPTGCFHELGLALIKIPLVLLGDALGCHSWHAIIGAGSAGAALAARLSENPQCTVLLLEAGRDYRSQETPLEIQSANPFPLLSNAQYHWPDLRVRRTAAQTAELYIQGRGVGGSLTINAQCAIRGVPEDYDHWAELGCAGWSSAEVLPTFRRLEDDLDFAEAPSHARGGPPIPISQPPKPPRHMTGFVTFACAIPLACLVQAATI